MFMTERAHPRVDTDFFSLSFAVEERVTDSFCRFFWSSLKLRQKYRFRRTQKAAIKDDGALVRRKMNVTVERNH